jgi:acid stress-induced BolA-like protein IbaG/YrbA
MNPSDISQLIEAGFENADVNVMSDDNTHFAATVVATDFEGLRSIARHQLIYKTLGSRMGNEIHALSIRAFTPEEWRHHEDQ